MQKESPKLAIIIVSYNTADLLEKCLNSIQKHIHFSHEVCVVDNASTDESMPLVRDKFPEVIRVPNSENRGFAAGINQGIRETTAPFIFWMNPDSEFLDDQFEALLHYMQENPQVAALGPKIVDPDGTIQLSCRAFPSYMNYLFGRHSIMTKLFPKNPFSQKFLMSNTTHDEVKNVDWVSGAAFLHRRELLHRIGCVDEGYFMYFEEVDYCQRIAKAGLKVVFHPGSALMHHIAGSSKKASSKMIIVREQSNWRYYTKHFKRNRFKDAFIASGLTAKCLVRLVLNLIPRKNKT